MLLHMNPVLICPAEWFRIFMSMRKVLNGERDLFGDLIIHRTTDEYGDVLVIERPPYRTLTFDSMYDQSSMDVRMPALLVHEYTHAMMLVLAFIKPRHVTLFGLGGGCLLRSLHDLLPKCMLHAVELRQKVYEVASEFFGIPTSKQIMITISDAETWLQNALDFSTDIIFSDMFDAYSMNPLQFWDGFFHQCHRVLSKTGWLVVNYHEIPDIQSAFFDCLCGVFSDVFIYKTIVGNNHIVYASKGSVGALEPFHVKVNAIEKELGNRKLNGFNRLQRVRG